MSIGNERIAYGLARYSVLVAVFLGLITSLIEVWLDYGEERGKIDSQIEQAIMVAIPSAAQSALQLDPELAEEVVQGLVSHEFIYHSSILDDFGNELSSVTKPVSTGNLFWVTEYFADPFPNYSRDLDARQDGVSFGTLQLSVNMDSAFSEFYSRVAVTFFSGIARNSLLAVFLLGVFYFTVGRPLMVLVSEIRVIDPKNPQPIRADIGKANSFNEIGQLKDTTNSLLQSSRDHFVELQDAQEQLRQNEVRLNDFARAASDWFWETDTEFRTIFSSDRYFELSGMSPDQVLDKEAHSEISDDSLDETSLETFAETIDARRPFKDFEYSLQKPDGQLMHVSVSGVPVFNENGAYQGYRGIGTDQTNLKKSELERERLVEVLHHAQKLRAVGQLTGGIAHDFNNLLAVILGNMELLQKEGDFSDSALESVGMAMDATKRGAQLTHRLLAYSRQQPLSPEPIDPIRVLNGLDDLLRRSLGEKVELEVAITAGVWKCLADRQELETVILNLAINARDAMPDGGKLTIEAFNTRLDEEYAMKGFEVDAGQYVCFAITDNGTGMSKEISSRAFDPYFTTKPVGKGSGLGLAMAFGFAKQSSGHIKIYSEEGDGTTIKVYMPRTESDPTNGHQDVYVPDELILKGKKILVVEDEDAVRQTLIAHLTKMGCIPVGAVDSVDAIRRCEEEHDFSLFLLDVVLPGKMKGLDLSSRLSELAPNAAVVFMSGYTENSIVHNGQLDEGVKLLQKPFSSAELITILIKALREFRKS